MHIKSRPQKFHLGLSGFVRSVAARLFISFCPMLRLSYSSSAKFFVKIKVNYTKVV